MTGSRKRSVWITGGGSGIGRAVAKAAASDGWAVAVSGRRHDALDETVAEIVADGGIAIAVPLDVTDSPAIRVAADAVAERLGGIDALVLAAGRNSPRRRWDDQDMSEFEEILATNVTAAAVTAAAALPHLRESRGVMVAVSSYAGWTFQPSAGVAYSASKTAMSSLVRTLNLQEATHGVRACLLCPGDVATDFLRQRPEVPDAAAQAAMLTPADVAGAVSFVLNAPAHVRIDELVVSPVSQA